MKAVIITTLLIVSVNTSANSKTEQQGTVGSGTRSALQRFMGQQVNKKPQHQHQQEQKRLRYNREYQARQKKQQSQKKHQPRSVVKPKSPLSDAFNIFSNSERQVIQSKLKDAGFYNSTIDGIWGRNTQKAIESYAKKTNQESVLTSKSRSVVMIAEIMKLNVKPEPNDNLTVKEVFDLESQLSQSEKFALKRARESDHKVILKSLSSDRKNNDFYSDSFATHTAGAYCDEALWAKGKEIKKEAGKGFRWVSAKRSSNFVINNNVIEVVESDIFQVIIDNDYSGKSWKYYNVDYQCDYMWKTGKIELVKFDYKNKPEVDGKGNDSNVAKATPASTALEMMQNVFIGNHSKRSIKIKISQALTLYGATVSEENYSRAGSVLVSLRKSTNVAEMEILDYMIKSSSPDIEIDFPDGASLSASFLSLGTK